VNAEWLVVTTRKPRTTILIPVTSVTQVVINHDAELLIIRTIGGDRHEIPEKNITSFSQRANINPTETEVSDDNQ